MHNYTQLYCGFRKSIRAFPYEKAHSAFGGQVEGGDVAFDNETITFKTNLVLCQWKTVMSKKLFSFIWQTRRHKQATSRNQHPLYLHMIVTMMYLFIGSFPEK